ncbi:WD40-repeat-containing domain protein [Infundibulicybe gibba]|nr:WD40-repeat-containing domain protein [Infundibulicybe gibba]
MENAQEHMWWAPTYSINDSEEPRMTACIKPRPDPDFAENFVRVAKWCPDGSVLLAQCENRQFQFFPSPNHQGSLPPGSPPRVRDHEASTKVFQQPSPILDFIWYPTATASNPATFCYVASVRECPVKLLDASDGRLRASYKIVDHRERQVAPHSLAFNLSGERLYCGFEDAIEVFDVAQPGEGTRLATTPSKKSKDGLKGIISAISFSPAQGSQYYAAGSLIPSTANIALYDEARGANPVMFVDGGPRAGVTQLHFNPLKPHILYAASRRQSTIYSWDIRSNVDAPINIYDCRGSSKVGDTSNQKMRFDVDITGRWLASGNQSGRISIFDLQHEPSLTSDDTPENTTTILPTLSYEAHGDSVGSVGFNPHSPLLFSASGSRHFHPESDNQSDDSSSSDEEVIDLTKESGAQYRVRSQPIPLDASIKFWDFSRRAALHPDL